MKMVILKTAATVILALVLMMSQTSAQFKSQIEKEESPSETLVHPSTSISSFLGILNPDNFMMRQSLSFNYMTSGGTALSLASFTNSMFYKIADPLNVRVDVTLQGSPFGSYGGMQQSDLSRLYLSRAELNYRPTDNTFVKFEFLQNPYYLYSPYDPYFPTGSSHVGDH
jgi:hypothetical protein